MKRIQRVSICALAFAAYMVPGTVSGQSTGFFDGYTLMKIPKSKLPIGATWNDVTGPVGEGVSSEMLDTTGSVVSFTSANDKNFKSGAEGTITKSLSADAGFSSSLNSTIELASVRVVKVKDGNYLKNCIGRVILYEAILADQVGFTVDKTRAADLRASLFKVYKNATIGADVETGNKMTISVSGAGLFIAYRLIKLTSSKPSSAKVSFVDDVPKQEVSLNGSTKYSCSTADYTISICACQTLACVREKGKSLGGDQLPLGKLDQLFFDCGAQWVMDITDRNEMSTGKPLKSHQQFKSPLAIQNQFFNLCYRTDRDGFEIDYLEIQELTFYLKDGITGIGMFKERGGKAYIRKLHVKFENYTSQTSGW